MCVCVSCKAWQCGPGPQSSPQTRCITRRLCGWFPQAHSLIASGCAAAAAAAAAAAWSAKWPILFEADWPDPPLLTATRVQQPTTSACRLCPPGISAQPSRVCVCVCASPLPHTRGVQHVDGPHMSAGLASDDTSARVLRQSPSRVAPLDTRWPDPGLRPPHPGVRHADHAHVKPV